MNKSNHRSPFAIVGRLIVLVKPMLPVMLAAIVMGVAGHFCATFITIFGGFGILRALGLASPVRTVGTAFACILVFALLRGVLRTSGNRPRSDCPLHEAADRNTTGGRRCAAA